VQFRRYDREQTNTHTHRQTDTLIAILRSPIGNKIRCAGAHPLRGALSQRGLLEPPSSASKRPKHGILDNYLGLHGPKRRTLLTTSRPCPPSLSRNPNGAPPDSCIVRSPSPASASGGGDVTSAILSALGAAAYVSWSSLAAVEQRQAGHRRRRRLGCLRTRSISQSAPARVSLIRRAASRRLETSIFTR